MITEWDGRTTPVAQSADSVLLCCGIGARICGMERVAPYQYVICLKVNEWLDGWMADGCAQPSTTCHLKC